MYCYSIGSTNRQDSAVRSCRNPISKPMRRQSGKTKISHSSKASTSQRNVPAEPAADSYVASPVTAEHSRSRKVDGSSGDVDTEVDVSEMFQSALAERVKLRRMSQLSSESSDVDKSEYHSMSRQSQLAAEKSALAGRKNLLKQSSVTVAGKKPNRSSAVGNAKNKARTVTKKTSAIRSAISSSNSKTKSVKSDVKMPVQKQQVNGRVMAASGTAKGKQEQSNKNLAVQKSKSLKSAVSLSKSGSDTALGSSRKCAAVDAKQSKQSGKLTKESVNKSADDAAKMPQLKANRKQNAVSIEVKSMPVLQQEKSPVKSDLLTKKAPRKRQKPTPTKVQPKSPKLSPADETSRSAGSKSLQNNDVIAETSFGDGDMPQLLAVEMPSDSKSLTVVMDQLECPPKLDQSLLCAAGEGNLTERKSSCQSPTAAPCPRENNDTAVKTSPRSVSTKDGDASKIVTPKQSPAKPLEQHAMPVSNCTTLSLYHCSISSPVAVSQTLCSISSRVAVTQCSLSDSQQTWTNCSISTPQPYMTPLKQTIVSVSETQSKAECLFRTDSTEPNTELVPYTSQQPSNVSASGQWQLPCGVPMAPFIITGMYPMIGSGGYGCQFMSLPPFVSPGTGMPAAASIISAGSPPLQYSSYHLPRPATAAPVVPLYMSPIVSPPPFVQASPTSTQVNLLPFMSSLSHAAVQNQPSSTTLILRPSMPAPPPADHMYCMLPKQQQVNLPLSAWSVSCLVG